MNKTSVTKFVPMVLPMGISDIRFYFIANCVSKKRIMTDLLNIIPLG